MKRSFIYTLLLFWAVGFSLAQNTTNLRALNAGGQVTTDVQGNAWQYSVGGTFVDALGSAPFITQGFNQLTFLSPLGIALYQDSIYSGGEVSLQDTAAWIVGVDTSNLDITRSIVIQNTSTSQVLEVDSLRFANGFFAVDTSRFVLDPAASQGILLSLTEKVVGLYQDTLLIYSNAEDSPQKLLIQGEVVSEPVPELAVFTPDTLGTRLTPYRSLNFGVLNPGDSTEISWSLANVGEGTLRLDTIQGLQLPFSVSAITHESLESGETLVFAVSFSGNFAGDFQDTLWIESNDPLEPRFPLVVKGVFERVTRWTENGWDNGVPDSASTVILEADYFTSESGGLTVAKLVVVDGVTLYIDDFFTTLEVADSLLNEGQVIRWCINPTSIEGTIVGDTIAVSPPEIFSDNFINGDMEGTVGQRFNPQFEVTGIYRPSWSIMGLPLGLIQNFNEIDGVPIALGEFELVVTAEQEQCTVVDTVQLFIADLPRPELEVRPVLEGVCGSTHQLTPFFQESDGGLSYALTRPSRCVTLDSVSGELRVLRADCPSPVEVRVMQERTDEFLGAVRIVPINLVKVPASLRLPQSVFDIATGDTLIPALTNSTSFPRFSTIDSSNQVITLSRNGRIELLNTGVSLIQVDVSENRCYQRAVDTLLLEVVQQPRSPIVQNDTLRFYIYQSNLEVNVLQNDSGLTALLDSNSLRFDGDDELVAEGIGVFFVDQENPGVVRFDPFEAFLGEKYVEYCVMDLDSLESCARIVVVLLTEEEIPQLEYRELYTPNSDGLNDVFIIGFLNQSAPGQLTVIDRLGNKVYENSAYANDWVFSYSDGTPVDDGTYFFVYEEEDRNKLQGAFEIRRK